MKPPKRVDLKDCPSLLQFLLYDIGQERGETPVEQRPQLHQRQKLNLSQALHRSLQILQFSQLELRDFLEEEIDKNPLLKRVGHPASRSSFSFEELPSKPSLYESLLAQVKESFSNETEKKLALALCSHLDEQGFLTHSLELLSVLYVTSLPLMKRLVTQLQTFSPPGIFARNLKEALLLQLERQGLKSAPVYPLIRDSFEDLLHGRYRALKKKTSLSSRELQTAIQKLSSLELRPTSPFESSPIQPLYPDLRIQKIGSGQWKVELVEELVPRFKIEEKYLKLPPLPPSEQGTLRTFTVGAKWLLRSVQRRRKLLLSLASHLIRKQTSYLNGTGPLVSLSPSKLAEECGVHESTISRALNEKYIDTPRGILPLKALCPVANDPAKELLQKLIAQENKAAPQTDEELAKEMEKKGWKLARRTIAKYRKELHISPASARKHLF